MLLLSRRVQILCRRLNNGVDRITITIFLATIHRIYRHIRKRSQSWRCGGHCRSRSSEHITMKRTRMIHTLTPVILHVSMQNSPELLPRLAFASVLPWLQTQLGLATLAPRRDASEPRSYQCLRQDFCRCILRHKWLIKRLWCVLRRELSSLLN